MNYKYYMRIAFVALLASMLAVVGAHVTNGVHVDVQCEGDGTVEIEGDTEIRGDQFVDIRVIPGEGMCAEAYVDGEIADIDGGVLRITASEHKGEVHVLIRFVPEPEPEYELDCQTSEGGSMNLEGQQSVPADTEQRVVITPDEGYVIEDVIVDGVSAGASNVLDVLMDGDHSVTPVFRPVNEDTDCPVDVDVDVTADIQVASPMLFSLFSLPDYGQVYPSGRVFVVPGASLTVGVMLNPGFCVGDLKVNGVSVGAVTEYTIEDIRSSVSIELEISEIVIGHSVVASAGVGGSISPEGRTDVAEGADLAFEISADPGYRLSYVLVDGVKVAAPEDGIFVLEDVMSDRTVEAVFSKIECTVVFQNYDGAILQTSNVPYGQKPVYNGDAPVRGPTAEFTYIFGGWNPEIGIVTENITYTAQYTAVVNKYVITFIDGDGKAIQVSEVPYGQMPVCTGTPSKTATPEFSYGFNGGWVPSLEKVTGDAKYTAQFDSIKNVYKVTWQDDNGDLIDITEVEYGQMPSHKDVIKASTPQYTFVFRGWTPNLKEVTGDTVYQALFTPVLREYTVIFQNIDGTVLQQDKIAYGQVPEYTGETPTNSPTVQYVYTFSGWDTEISAVIGDIVYTAQFDEELREYDITFENYDGSVLQTCKVAYGEIPKYTGSVPTKDSTVQYVYAFSGWDKDLSAVVDSTVYTAQFNKDLREYKVTVVAGENGTVSDAGSFDVPYGTEIVMDGSKVSVGIGHEFVAVPDEMTAQYTFEFKNWNSSIIGCTVTGPVVLTANFSSTINKYTVTWQDDSGKTIDTATIEYGMMPSHTDPVKAADVQYTYAFKEWIPALKPVTGNIIYEASFIGELREYTVAFQNYDNTVLQTDKVGYGEMPVYSGKEPVRFSTPEFEYTFSGWDKAIVPVTGDVTYVAQFIENLRGYTVLWKNGDTILETDENVLYGTMPVYDGSVPVKDATVQFTFTFDKWSPAVSKVTGDAIYTAQFTESVNRYNISFVDGNGIIIQSSNFAYGQMPVCDTIPTKFRSAEFSYEFNGEWLPALEPVSGDAFYNAQFKSIRNIYTVTWNSDDGSQIGTTEVEYGQMPVHADAVKASTPQYTYEFSGWCPELKKVTGNITYTAQFTANVREYTVIFVDGDGKTIQSGLVRYGDMPSYDGDTPTKAAPEGSTFTFNGNWVPALGKVTGNVTYTAQFTEKTNEYKVTFVDGDGKIIQSGFVEYGKVPSYNGPIPTKSSTAEFSYAFDKWIPELGAVNGDITYTAQFTEELRGYTVTWKNWNGDILETDEGVSYGSIPEYNGQIPARTDTAEFSYTFSTWSPSVSEVTGPITYIAEFISTVNMYTVTFVDGDGDTIQVSEIPYGKMPVCSSIPVKTADAEFSYTFNGTWIPEIETVSEDATYVAQFDSIKNRYVITWQDDNGDVIDVTEFDYGEMPVHADAVKTADEKYTYEFKEWIPALEKVTGSTSYKASFIGSLREYTVTFQNYDRSILQTGQVEYGVVPVYEGDSPVRDSTVQHVYTFSGWDKDITEVKGDVTYTAQFTENLRGYTVIWKNWNGDVLESDEGEVPTKDADVQYTYEFTGWSPDITGVKCDATYTAQFIEKVRNYEVAVVTDNYGSVMGEGTYEVPYGTEILISGPVLRIGVNLEFTAVPYESNAQYTFAFGGWTSSEDWDTVIGPLAFVANFTKVVNRYAVVWENWNGDVLETDDNVLYGTVPVYNGEIPTKDADAQYIYAFDSWSPEISEVTGEAVYTAQFTETLRGYTVTWENWNGDVLETDENVPYGTVPEYNGEMPTKDADAQYIYGFIAWSPEISEVTGEVVYTAQFTETLRGYTVTWENWNGDVLETDENILYGTLPEYNGGIPVRQITDQYIYAFDSWSPEISEVTGEVVYTAQFTETLRGYTVTWENWNGDVLETDENNLYGTLPEYNGDLPVKDADAQYTYTFDSWSPEISEVTGETVYTAQFTETLRNYELNVTAGENGSVTGEGTHEVPYGTEIVITGAQVKVGEDLEFTAIPCDSTAQYTFSFFNWELSEKWDAVIGPLTLTAKFTKTVNEYTVVWKNWNGEVLETDENIPYGALPEYNGENPVREPTEQFTYTFNGWNPVLSKVSKDVVYTAQFTPVKVFLISVSAVNNQPEKIYYVGDLLDNSTVTAVATFSNGRTVTDISLFTFNPQKFTMSGEPDENGVPRLDVTVGYTFDNVTESDDISVIVMHKLDNISVTTYPSKMDYYTGQSLSRTGMVITATYDDGKTEVVTDRCTITPDHFSDVTDKSPVTVSYTEDGIERTCVFNVNVGDSESLTSVVTRYSGQAPDGKKFDYDPDCSLKEFVFRGDGFVPGMVHEVNVTLTNDSEYTLDVCLGVFGLTGDPLLANQMQLSVVFDGQVVTRDISSWNDENYSIATIDAGDSIEFTLIFELPNRPDNNEVMGMKLSFTIDLKGFEHLGGVQ